MEILKDNKILTANKIRMLFSNTLYNNENLIKDLLGVLEGTFSCFTIEYNTITKSIFIKIRKTDMKKNLSLFQHASEFYYNYINECLYNIFMKYYDLLNIIMRDNATRFELTLDDMIFFSNKNNMSLLYNVTALMDNIIMINL